MNKISKTELIKGYSTTSSFSEILNEIKQIVKKARYASYMAVNHEMLKSYFEIGKRIVEEEQKGQKRAGYGEKLLERLSKELNEEFGKGFDASNLRHMRRFYLTYKKWETVSPKLCWSHYCELIKIKDDKKRRYYEKYIAEGNLSIRDLKRQIISFHYERLMHKDPMPKQAEDVIKDPYIFDFIRSEGSEKDIEEGIIGNIQRFLLELGQGFAFVARQKMIKIGKRQYFIDLLFYNTCLKCYVAVEIKNNAFSHRDAGQMNFYLNFIDKELNGENKPIGIILCRDRDKVKAEYATSGISHKVFVSKYMLFLPSKEELEKAAA